MKPIPNNKTAAQLSLRKKRKVAKPRSNTKILTLKAEEREQVIRWMFDENLAYKEVAHRVHGQFGLKISPDSLGDYYHVEAKRRTLNRILSSADLARDVVKSAGENPDEVYQAVVRVFAQAVFEASVGTEAGKPPDLTFVMQALPLLMDARKETRDDQEIALERERWEFDVVRMCHDHFNELQKILANETLDEPSRLQAIRRRLFGKNLAASEQ